MELPGTEAEGLPSERWCLAVVVWKAASRGPQLSLRAGGPGLPAPPSLYLTASRWPLTKDQRYPSRREERTQVSTSPGLWPGSRPAPITVVVL